MSIRKAILSLCSGATLVGSPTASAEPALHVGYEYDSCYIDLHPELTQAQFRRFTREFADVGAFSSMSGARTLAPWKVALAFTYDKAFIPDEEAQWNNTFSHPGADHWLGQPAIPTLQAKLGLPRNLEAEASFTTDPMSNWGAAGLAVRANVLRESPQLPVSAAVRVEYLRLLGAGEVDLDAATVGGVASRSYGRFTPYLAVDATVAYGREKTMDVDLDAETTLSARGMLGLEVALWRFRIAGQGTLATVPSAALMLSGVI